MQDGATANVYVCDKSMGGDGKVAVIINYFLSLSDWFNLTCQFQVFFFYYYQNF